MIKPLNRSLETEIQKRIDEKTKPLGSLGQLEHLAKQIALIQGTLNPKLNMPSLILFAGDHGLVDEGISPYPQQVTVEMLKNFVAGGAAINCFARQHDLDLSLIDCGTKIAFSHPQVIPARQGPGTKNSLKGPAMTNEQLKSAVEHGRKLVLARKKVGSNVIGFGEMGIGNSSAAALITSRLCDVPLEACVGRGTGCDDRQLRQKSQVLRAVLENHSTAQSPLEVMQAFGGFEMATALGAILAAAEEGILILMDGFIMSAVGLAAVTLQPHVLEYMVFCHRSASPGHRIILETLGVEPVLDLSMRLGEGTGIAVAYPLLESAVCFLNSMASFKEAEVSRSL
ncbi:nicotinate-nucleotide--dimethylbenzimidazole phosphoribosyltransferase [Pseudobacteriovorax antillogorgiicola]|uniref:Nicotinate-nucleotide--dimethylbenzimidazole phosphoribosyltransferase n=1 Tax=Pseudobacteriovorax antillogorgiicola TaxID=1513793 RepID=A0A1Y6C7J6_9BACT|nr:nicotinate-nucleotide--dimethylbenzimidazole phosphoribosyltransferase [Pseudobacteriovorax antillogorgiicola]TCS50689.1 nicotinate-nucleotide-dimethylbenzimidazole phosphoribosyltransferase [Pseudobacteriovorax antillogorgiicola]SMF40308.1 nicotinate-nucleotide-dimethylbenzimidazole phosphoribosyltransferase [Pseudobacteriovorax antillogorgiicola]